MSVYNRDPGTSYVATGLLNFVVDFVIRYMLDGILFDTVCRPLHRVDFVLLGRYISFLAETLSEVLRKYLSKYVHLIHTLAWDTAKLYIYRQCLWR